MPQKDGRTRFRRCANSWLIVLPQYSSFVRSQCTEKLIVVGRLPTPSCDSMRTSPG